jgi:tripartite-type tricarboxylate transporter receptor subunit TctC
MTTRQSRITRRTLLQGVAAAGAFGLGPAAAQTATWPDRPVRIIVPYPAGGSTDVLARILAEQLKNKLGQPFVIENRPGAGGNVGIDALAKSSPDGYTIAAATVGNFAINQYLYARMPYDAERDIIAASLTWELPNVAVVASQYCPAKTLSEFITWAKALPNGITYGTPGVGTTPHLSGALFAKRSGIKATHVPFRGAAQTIPAMLSGDVTFALDNLASYTSIIESGQMRALAVTSPQRWPTLKDIPTMAEAGVPDFIVTSWAGFVVPAGTPRPIIDKLSAAMREIAADTALQERFLIAGGRCIASTPEEAAAFAAKERVLFKEMVQVSGARVD